MANLSQKKRQRMLTFLNTLKEERKTDDEMLITINEIENALNEKKYGLVWEQHEEAVDMKMRTHIPVFTEDKDLEIAAAPGEPYNFLLEADKRCVLSERRCSHGKAKERCEDLEHPSGYSYQR